MGLCLDLEKSRVDISSLIVLSILPVRYPYRNQQERARPLNRPQADDQELATGTSLGELSQREGSGSERRSRRRRRSTSWKEPHRIRATTQHIFNGSRSDFQQQPHSLPMNPGFEQFMTSSDATSSKILEQTATCQPTLAPQHPQGKQASPARNASCRNRDGRSPPP